MLEEVDLLPVPLWAGMLSYVQVQSYLLNRWMEVRGRKMGTLVEICFPTAYHCCLANILCVQQESCRIHRSASGAVQILVSTDSKKSGIWGWDPECHGIWYGEMQAKGQSVEIKPPPPLHTEKFLSHVKSTLWIQPCKFTHNWKRPNGLHFFCKC